MANYSLVINSKFQPFSLERYLQPMQIYGEAYREQQDAISELATKANVWDEMANEVTDPIAYSQYKAYANDLAQQADNLARYGLNPTSRQKMLNMKERYAKEITPIEIAYNTRKEQMKQQADILTKDPTHLFARNASTTSLDEYLMNPSLDTLEQQYSGALLTQQVANAASALAKDARNDPNVQTELRRLLPYQYETIRRTGFDPETVRQAILNSPNADKILTGIVDRTLSNAGLNDWSYISEEDRERIINRAREYANEGLWSAVGQTQYGQLSDTYSMNVALENLKHQHNMDEIYAKGTGSNPEDTESGIRHWGMGVETNSKHLGTAKEFLNKLSSGKASDYTGDSNINPLRIYKEYKKLGTEGEGVGPRTFINPRTGASYGASYETWPGNYKEAEKAIKKKYGVTAILSDSEYQALKSLGYTDDYNQDFSDLQSRINRGATQYSATSINIRDYDNIEGAIFPTLARYYDKGNDPGFLYEYTPNGRGKPVKYKDIVSFDKKGNPDVHLKDVSYSVKSPDDVIITVGGNDYFMNPEGYGRELTNIIQGYKSLYWDFLSSNEDKAKYQDVVTEAIRNELDRFNKTRTRTSSSR